MGCDIAYEFDPYIDKSSTDFKQLDEQWVGKLTDRHR